MDDGASGSNPHDREKPQGIPESQAEYHNQPNNLLPDNYKAFNLAEKTRNPLLFSIKHAHTHKLPITNFFREGNATAYLISPLGFYPEHLFPLLELGFVSAYMTKDAWEFRDANSNMA